MQAANVLWGVLLLGCAAPATPIPQVPIKREYASERTASVTRPDAKPDYAVVPEAGAERVLQVDIDDNASQSGWRGHFFSDGTLQVEDHIFELRTSYVSAKLSAAELQRLQAEMPALELCRRAAAACIDVDESVHGIAYRRFEIFSGPLRGKVVEHYRGARAPAEFLQYEDFLIDLIKQTVGRPR